MLQKKIPKRNEIVYSWSWILLKICLDFKSSHFAGDSNDYMGVSIKDGGVALSINLGNGRLDTGIKNKNVRFDDDVWHHVVIFRVAQQVRKQNYTYHLQRGHP